MHNVLNAAYLFYYAVNIENYIIEETEPVDDEEGKAKLLKKVMNQLMHDILILAKKVGYILTRPLIG